jgi:hypothetical protein
MAIGRRTFIRRTLLAGSAPALASVAFEPAHAISARQPAASGAGVGRVVFKIDGWDRRDTLPAVPPDNSPPDHHVWIAVNRSWRAAWR